MSLSWSPPANERPSARDVALVLLAALVALALRWSTFDTSHLHVQGAFVDQAGYVTTARHLADHGELRSGLIYPAYAADARWRPYMPGHYVTLAAAYKAFGYGVVQTLLPNLAGLVVSALLVLWIGARVVGRRIGLVAALALLCVPGEVGYAYTAMAELTFQTAGLAGLALLLLVPVRLRAWALPIAVAVPFSFRETGALYLAPLALLVLADGRPRALRRAALASAGGVLAVLLLHAWQVAEGKGAPPLSWVTEGVFNYEDAFPRTRAAPELGAWPGLLLDNAWRNISELGRQLRDDPGGAGSVGGLMLALLTAASLVAGVRRRSPLALGAAGIGLALFAAAFLLYDVKAHKLLRTSLYALPLLGLGTVELLLPRQLGRRGRLATAGLLVAAFLTSELGVRRIADDLIGGDGFTAQRLAFVKRLHHDDSKLLIGPREMCLQYMVQRYPVPVSFLPANTRTLDLLKQRFEVGTVIYPRRKYESKLEQGKLSTKDMPLHIGMLTLFGLNYRVFQER